jgi:hypothetical protein
MRAVFLLLLTSVALEPSSLPQSNSGAGDPTRVTAQMADRVQQVLSVTAKLPRVDVTHADFGVGCANPADPRGRADSTCAIRNAVRFAQANPVPGSGYPVLYFPHGRYLVAGDGYTAPLSFTAGVSLVGDGAQSTTIFNASPTAGTVAYNKANECARKPGPCFIKIEGITFAANGHHSMGGLIEINSTNTGLMRDVVLAETGGIALNVQGSSERWIFSQIEIDHARWAVLTEGDTNENYFERVNIIDPGQDESHFCFSVNCPAGQLMAPGGTWLPDPHSAVYLDGDNVHWNDSSIKSTAIVGGLHLANVTTSVRHTYIEGYPWGGQPRENHAVEIGGKLELGHLTQRIGAGDLLIPVDDAGWQPLYVNDPALATINDTHSYTPVFNIFPADYVFGSREPSAAVPGITRGTSESILVASFTGDGKAHVIARGQNGTAAIAWPAGSIIEQIANGGYGQAHLESNHFNSLHFDTHARYASGCDDTAQLTRWTSSPSRLCAEIIAGVVPDGYGVPFPPQHYVTESFALEISGNSIFTGGDEQYGQGWIKIAGNGEVNLDQGDPPLRAFTSADTALNTYVNGNTRVQVVKYGNVSALAVVHDLSANVMFSPQEHYYTSDIMIDNSLSHQYLGQECWYAMQPGNRPPARRFCLSANGPVEENLVNGRWMAAH